MAAATEVASVEGRVAAVLESLPARPALQELLGELGRLAPPPQLVHPLRRICAGHASPAVRFTAERLLRFLPDAPLPPELCKPVDPARVEAALGAPEPEVRLHGLGACQALAPEAANPMLRRLINRPEPDPWVLSAAIAALGLVGGPEVAEEAASLIDHPVPRVAANALSALNQREHRTAVLAARARLDSDDPRMRAHAVVAVYPESQAAAWSRVEEMAASEHLWMRATACSLATALPHPGAEAVLLRLVDEDDDPEILIKAVDALGRKGGPAALGALASLSREASLTAPIARKALDTLQARLGVSREAIEEAAAGWSVAREARGGRPIAPGPAPSLEALPPPAPPPTAPVPEPVRPGTSPSEILHRSQISHLIPPAPAPGPAEAAATPSPGPPGEPPSSFGQRLSSSALRLEKGFGAVAPPAPESFWSEARLRRFAGGLTAALAGIAVLTWVVSTTRPGPKVPEPPPLPPPASAPGAPVAASARLAPDGSTDLNAQPATGTRAAWTGAVKEGSARRLVVELAGGSPLALHFGEDLPAVPTPGTRVAIEGTVFRKGRQGITLVPGSQVRVLPADAP